MSDHTHSAHSGVHEHGHHGHDDHAHQVHYSRRDYTIGFLLSVVLTAVPFWLVMSGVALSPQAIGIVVMVFAAAQIVVHMIYFLHMNSQSEGGWNMLAMTFTIVIVVIMIAGSLWVMYHLNTNMMPMGAVGSGATP